MSCNSVDLIVPGVLSNRGRFSVTHLKVNTYDYLAKLSR